jgi:hypothetical protein
MNCMKTLTITTFTILLIAATTFTKAQTTPVGNALPPTVSKFNDIVEMNLSEVGNEYVTGIEMAFTNVFAYKPTDHFSAGIGIGLEDIDNAGLSVPLSADFRWYFNPSKVVTPFLNLNSGYALILGMVDSRLRTWFLEGLILELILW